MFNLIMDPKELYSVEAIDVADAGFMALMAGEIAKFLDNRWLVNLQSCMEHLTHTHHREEIVFLKVCMDNWQVANRTGYSAVGCKLVIRKFS